MPDRRSFHTRRCDVFAEPKNKREALIKAENDAEYARLHESPAQDDPLIAEARPNPMCSGCGKSDKAIRGGAKPKADSRDIAASVAEGPSPPRAEAWSTKGNFPSGPWSNSW